MIWVNEDKDNLKGLIDQDDNWVCSVGEGGGWGEGGIGGRRKSWLHPDKQENRLRWKENQEEKEVIWWLKEDDEYNGRETRKRWRANRRKEAKKTVLWF